MATYNTALKKSNFFSQEQRRVTDPDAWYCILNPSPTTLPSVLNLRKVVWNGMKYGLGAVVPQNLVNSTPLLSDPTISHVRHSINVNDFLNILNSFNLPFLSLTDTFIIIIIIAHIYNAPNTTFLGAEHIITPVIGFRLTCTQGMHILHSLGSIPASRHFTSATC